MFKIIGWIIKLSVLIGVVLVLSHLVRWNGKTISDQVKSHVSHAEKTQAFKDIKKWAEDKLPEKSSNNSSEKNSKKNAFESKGAQKLSSTESSQKTEKESDEIKASERQKLRALIGELNHSAKQQSN